MTDVKNDVGDVREELSERPPSADTPTRFRHFRPLQRFWRWLTSMRTALILLFLLALGVVPGSVLPQRNLNQAKVDQYFAQHPHLAPWFDRLSLFNVFSAPWFAAIYLLLFISLIGCVVPRFRQHIAAMRAAPPVAPRRFSRLPQSTSYETEQEPDAAAADALAQLKRGRWRVVRREDGGVVTISAEKGYLRETGNLIFHSALTLLLIAVAVGRLWGYHGSIIVQDGDGFCNTVQQYDTFKAGDMVGEGALAPFCATMKKFTASYDNEGTATEFRSDVTYTEGTSGPTKSTTIRSNHPLRMEGLRLYLLGHGYSPVFTVKDASGHVFKGVSAPFLPQDANFSSQGALKLPDAEPKQLAIEGLFLPSVWGSGQGKLVSQYPLATTPMVAIFAYEGNLGLDSGEPQSVYSIDQAQVDSGKLKQVGQKNLREGESLTLKDGTKITFTGYKQWANLQVSRDPAQTWALVAAVLILVGLIL
ncbi:MAG TPA: cytochrome c biogenesis protein ResB, partial [Mycobacteriales bacterium]|nr:cytochrome c biogenesis protein ResB [Mycobacteriales bacterium]